MKRLLSIIIILGSIFSHWKFILESNIEREQVSVNKRRCIVLEQKTMLYVVFIAMDILAMILYCIVMKLLELQIGF